MLRNNALFLEKATDEIQSWRVQAGGRGRINTHCSHLKTQFKAEI